MKRRERRPSAGEIDLWRDAMRHAVPLTPDRALAAPPKAPPPPAPLKPRLLTTASPAPAAFPIASPVRPHPRRGVPAGIDRNLWRRLAKGAVPVEGRLDLHGLTQEEAHRRLVLFLGHAQIQGSRCVVVITGRGDRDRGVLKQAVPHWLDSPPNAPRVLAYAPARPQHGGDGALYVLLRRRR
ncbi:MAG: Smr/MutS family protein [Geminicoccaceae bacterium]|nr:Smr/MutS family protein [Geminicoccaceae bacterium]